MNRRTCCLSSSLLGIFAGLLLISGCGDDGPRRYDLSGQVTWQGKPVPAGTITFTPDAEQGNSGPQGFAEIKQGRFDTSAENGRGVVGGPHVIAILGYDGQNPTETDIHGARLFPEYQTKQDLPREGAAVDFDVP